MDWIHTLQIDRLGAFAQRHVGEISYAMATSLVVMVSAPINGLASRFAGRLNFVLRTLCYVVLFTVGYASIAYWSEKVLRQFLTDQKPIPLVVLTIGAFLGFGIWSGQRKLK
ncbi:MAG: hypothetical protein RL173_3399 [Fibrobacterota bacterium]|jgi:uncharacterized membrane protein (UPF0136 family)